MRVLQIQLACYPRHCFTCTAIQIVSGKKSIPGHQVGLSAHGQVLHRLISLCLGYFEPGRLIGISFSSLIVSVEQWNSLGQQYRGEIQGLQHPLHAILPLCR